MNPLGSSVASGTIWRSLDGSSRRGEERELEQLMRKILCFLVKKVRDRRWGREFDGGILVAGFLGGRGEGGV